MISEAILIPKIYARLQEIAANFSKFSGGRPPRPPAGARAFGARFGASPPYWAPLSKIPGSAPDTDWHIHYATGSSITKSRISIVGLLYMRNRSIMNSLLASSSYLPTTLQVAISFTLYSTLLLAFGAKDQINSYKLSCTL